MTSLARVLSTLIFLNALPAEAQVFEGIDLNTLPIPVTESPFYGLRGGTRLDGGKLQTALRGSIVIAPLVLRATSPAPEGYEIAGVEGSFVMELAFAIGLGHGFDVGLSMGAHLYQWGPGLGPLTGGETGISSFGVHDPKLEVGYSQTKKNISWRPYLALTLPLGSSQAFSGEDSVTGEVGAAIQGAHDWLTWGAELGLVLRKKTELSSTAWGSQLHVAGGLLFALAPSFSLGPEVHLLPLLVSQPNSDGAKNTMLFPAEALLTAALDGDAWKLKLSGGTGLPLSRYTSGDDTVWRRGPSSPNFRLGADFRLSLY